MGDRVVVVGDALIDELRDDNGVREFVGGAALNVAVGLQRLGVAATLIAMVGDDEAGEHIRRYLADHGVELLATPSSRGSSRAVSTRSGAGEPTYEFNDAAWNRGIRFGDAERAAMTDAAMVAVSCYPFDDDRQTEELADALGGTRVAIDPNPRTGMLHDRARFVAGFEKLVSGAALVKVGDDDARLLYDADLDVLRARLIDLGAEAVLATAGSSGATLEADRHEVTRPISSLPGRVIDTMGAGDAAFATVIAAMAADPPADADAWEAVLTRSMDVAAATCRFEGALLRQPSALASLDLDAIGT
ncbi:carbohydrate kinase [Microbacterium awajiense]|uniref:Carbohydrate kinase n=1 Tax=Microbacterium awajiense TaxID=415214 RepID=A0ABP7AYX4_9MICO